MPKPIEYEFEEHHDAPPETEAQAAARLLREDEETARRMGLVQEKGAPLGRKWQDGIGGDRTNAAARRLLEQETRAAERTRAARNAALKLVVGAAILLVLLGGAAAVAADYYRVVDLGIFARPSPAPVPAVPPTAVTAATPSPVAPGNDDSVASVPAAAPAPPSEASADPAASERLAKQLAAAERGIATIQSTLAGKQAAIRSHLMHLYGCVPNPRDEVPQRSAWVAPCAAIALEQARSGIPLQNAQAAVNNLNAYLRLDRVSERDIEARLRQAISERDELLTALGQTAR